METTSSTNYTNSRVVLDRLGTIASSVCALHCVLCALAPALLTLGCMQRPVQDILEPERRFNAVACFGKLQACFAREATARTLIANAAARLNEGGYFFGFLPDSSHIWCVPSRPAAHCGRGSTSHLPAAHQDEGAGAAARECWELRARRR